MSWLFSQVLVEEYSAALCLDGEQSVQSSGNPTQQAYCAPDKMTAFSRLSRFGMTFKPLTVSHGEDLNESLATLPRSGMTRNGLLWELPMLEQTIKGTEFGLSEKWATPTTMDTLPPKSEKALHKEATQARPGRSKPANLRDQVSNMQNWPTPCATDYKGSGQTGQLRDRLDYTVERGATKSKDYTWPTPRTKGMCGGSGAWQQLKANTTIEEAKAMGAGNGGKLNPTWVEWLMGWPLGWTDLKPLVTDKSHCVPQQHGDS